MRHSTIHATIRVICLAAVVVWSALPPALAQENPPDDGRIEKDQCAGMRAMFGMCPGQFLREFLVPASTAA